MDKTNTLTVNGITKMCSDKIILNSNGDIVSFQWHLFQLQKICNYLDISTKHPVFNYSLTRMQLYELLFKNDPITIEENQDIKNFGLVPNKIKNSYSDDNLGGMPLEKLKLNHYKNDVIFSDRNRYVYSEEYIKYHSKYTYEDDAMHIYKSRLENGLNKIKLAKEAGNICKSYGKLNWINNYCYMDTVLMALLLPVFDTRIHPYVYNNILTKKFTPEDFSDELYGLKLCKINNETLDIPKTLDSIHTIQSELQKISDLIIKGNIDNADLFVKSLQLCDNKAYMEYWQGNMSDSVDALNTILSIFLVPVQYYAKKKEIFIYDDTDFKNISSIGKLESDLKKIDLSSIQKYENYIENSSDHHVTIYNIDFDIIKNEFTKVLGEPIDPVQYNQEEYIYSKMLNRIFLKSQESMLDELKTTFSIPIDTFFNIQKDVDLEDYWNFDEDKYDTTIIQNTRYFYKLEDKGQVDRYMTINQIDKDIFKKVYRKIENISIIDGHLVWFHIQRNTYVKNILDQTFYTDFLDIQIIPLEQVHIQGNMKQLYYVHCFLRNHYILFFRCNSNWYIYNDKYDIVDSNSDYFEEVGSYSDLLEYSYHGIDRIVQRHSTLLMYA